MPYKHKAENVKFLNLLRLLKHILQISPSYREDQADQLNVCGVVQFSYAGVTVAMMI